jgi:hypothetical protein
MLVAKLAVISALVVTTLFFARVGAAAAPEKQVFTDHVDFPDFFDDDPNSPRCDFPVVGSWDVVFTLLTFADESTGNPTKVILFVDFDGTLSNPASGVSLPDGGMIKVTDVVADDGSVTEVEQATRFNPLFHSAYRRVTTDAGIVADVGRDWLYTDAHPIDITPLCEALA